MSLNLWKLAIFLSDVIIPFTLQPAVFAISNYSTSFPIFGVGSVFNFIYPDRYAMVSHYGFSLYFPDD